MIKNLSSKALKDNRLTLYKKNQNEKITMNFPILQLNQDIQTFNQIEFELHNKNSEKLTYIIHRSYITQRFNQRKGTANTLTRSEVRGGGRKPWRQKGTGRARAGSSRSPLWRGGGVSFGPKVKEYSNKINRKEWHLALRSLLIKKSKNIFILDNLEHLDTQNKTKFFKLNIVNVGINFDKNTVIIVNPNNSSLSNLYRITKNIKKITVLLANKLNIVDLVHAENLLITKDSLNLIKENYDK